MNDGNGRLLTTRILLPLVGSLGLLVLTATLAWSQDKPADPATNAPANSAEPSEESKMEYKANDMLQKGLELLEMKQEERGLKMIQSVPDLFPKAKARFQAYLLVAKFYMDSREFELAIKQLAHLSESEDPGEQAEGLYQMGICYYSLNQYDRSFMALRKVTNDFPWSIVANEAYYYIGQCHFKMGRWAKAIEALEMVGTSVAPNEKGQTLAEAGQRLYLKVHDKDLVVLHHSGDKLSVTVAASSGDKEQITMGPLDRSGAYYIGSVATALGQPKSGDGTLQIKGGDTVSTTYSDSNSKEGKLNVSRLSTVQMVSSATVGFTDGAYREYTKGVFGDSEAFIRIKDLDRDTTADRDRISVKVLAQYKVQKEEDPNQVGVDLEEEPENKIRDQIEVTLTESGPHTGLFVGTITPKVIADAALANPTDAALQVVKGDDLVLDYVDDSHIAGPEPRQVAYAAKLLIGQIQDVKIITRKVDDLDLRARKNLIEAKIYLKLGQIFKDVGLTNKANEKASEGLDRVQEVINTSLKASLDRTIVEDAFSVKWDLLLVQDKLQEAIGVCQTLTQLFPDSSMVDKALLKIGLAKAQSENPGEAIAIFNAVIWLKKSELKAEAQYNIGLVVKKMAKRDAEIHNRPEILSSAMMAFKACADNYPNSSFAGESLDEIANYYLSTKDYARAIELMDRVMQDYPDSSFLDRMLLHWGVAAYRSGDSETAKEKLRQLLAEYPQSPKAATARDYLKMIEAKSGN